MADDVIGASALAREAREGFVGWPSQLAAEYRARGWWAGQTIGTRPAEWARRAPDAAALREGDRVVTTGELARLVDNAARHLRLLGLRGGSYGDRILVQLPNTIELVVLLLACARAGVVPVLALPAHRRTELGALLALSEARAIAVPADFRGFDHESMAAELAAENPVLETILVLPKGPEAQPRPGHHDLRRLLEEVPLDSDESGPGQEVSGPKPADVAFLLLSGGTTGTPKLIARTHDDYLYNLRASAQVCGWGADTVFLASVPVTHNFSLACPGVLGALEAGGQVVLTASPEPAAALDAIGRHEVTDVAVVPAVLQRWLDEVRATGRVFPALRAVQVGGARLAEEVGRQVAPVLGATLQQALGMAEGLINYTRMDDPEDVACLTQGRPISPGDEIRIVDPDGVDVPTGTPGELLTRGPYTIRGYWRAPEKNRTAFTDDGWYRTGDVVRLHPSGNLVVEGRTKDVINRGGEKVSAEEVEGLLYRLSSVSRAAAVAVADPDLGERVAAVVVPTDPADPPTLGSIRSALLDTGVAKFTIPEVLLVVDELPLTKVGKLDKVALRRWVSQGQR